MRILTAFVILFATAFTALGSEPHYLSTEAQLQSLTEGLNFFQTDLKRYPTTSEGLAALVSKPASISFKEWPGPLMNSIKDSWGRDFVYVCPGVHNTNSYDLYSLGEDGISKTAGNDPDDVNNWDSSRHWMQYYNHPSGMQGTILMGGGGVIMVVLLLIAVWRVRR